MDLKEEAILGDQVGRHWYYRSKAKAVRTYLPIDGYRRVLDVGAGSGFFTRDLLASTPVEEGTCVDTGYSHDWEETVAGKPIRFRRSYDGEPVELALFMDVLEHVDDDTGVLSSYVERLPRGAHIFITVPAFHFLWSGHDDFLEHRRRYTVSSLRRTVEDAGLRTINTSYYFGFVFPIAAARRVAQRMAGAGQTPKSDLQRHSPIVNGLLGGLCALERPLMRFNRLAGLSVFHLAEKP